MAVTKNVMVRAGADFSALDKAAKKAKASMSGMRTDIEKGCNGIKNAFSGLKKVIGALSIAYVAKQAVQFGKEAKEAYEKQAESEAKLAQVMKNTMNASTAEIRAIKQLTAAQQALGVVGDEVQLAGSQELASYVKKTKTLESLIPVMNDMIAQQYGFNATQESAVSIATTLGKVMNGQTSVLTRHGYAVTDAQERVLKFGTEEERAAVLAEIVESRVGGMNAALAATPSGRLKQVSNVLGDIKEEFGRAVTTIASVFIPALNRLCEILINITTFANRAAQAVANVFSRNVQSAAASTEDATAAMEDLETATTAAGKAADKLGSYGFDKLNKLSSGSSGDAGENGSEDSEGLSAGIDADAFSGPQESLSRFEDILSRIKKTAEKFDLGKISSSLDGLKRKLEPLGKAAWEGIKWGYDNVLEPLALWTVNEAVPKFLDAIGSIAEKTAPAFKNLELALRPLKKGLFEALKWAYDNIFLPIEKWLGGEVLPAALNVLAGACRILTSVIASLKPYAEWIWANVLKPAAEWIGPILVKGLELLAQGLEIIAEWMQKNSEIVGILAAALLVLTNPIALVIAAVAALVTLIKVCIDVWPKFSESVTSAVGSVKNALNNVRNWIETSVIQPVVNAFKTAVSSIKGFFTDLWTTLKNIFGSVASFVKLKVMDPIVDTFKARINEVISLVEGFVNLFIKAINAILSAFNKISFDIPDWVPVVGGKTFGISIPELKEISLPRLAEGAVLPGKHPYAAIVNDQRSGVNVESPLSTIVEAVMIALRENPQQSDVNVIVKAIFDGPLAPLARILAPEIQSEIRRVGSSAARPAGGI